MLRKSPKLEHLRLKDLSFEIENEVRYPGYGTRRFYRTLYQIAETAWLREIDAELPVVSTGYHSGNTPPPSRASEPLVLPHLQHLSVSYPGQENHAHGDDRVIYSYMTLHLASLMHVPASARVEFIFPDISSALPRLWKIAARGRQEDVPDLKYGLKIWSYNSKYHFFDLETPRDDPLTSLFRFRQDTWASKNMVNLVHAHSQCLPLAQIVDLEINVLYGSPCLLPGGLADSKKFPVGSSCAEEYAYIPAETSGAHRGRRWSRIDSCPVRRERRILHGDFEFVLQRCSVTAEIINSLQDVAKIMTRRRGRTGNPNATMTMKLKMKALELMKLSYLFSHGMSVYENDGLESRMTRENEQIFSTSP
ncbi:hypothetical protein B0H17DRAFT_1141744 [Mycena rosella]|uniref:Uncharacterized protein n=1 Tax=Mycena rosella TaxID=1033263 RepID=A0AAD7G8N8_MYCRO|nr:hypothetical protein B0H17DRAFT_1141744 [Mycena rosella]